MFELHVTVEMPVTEWERANAEAGFLRLCDEEAWRYYRIVAITPRGRKIKPDHPLQVFMGRYLSNTTAEKAEAEMHDIKRVIENENFIVACTKIEARIKEPHWTSYPKNPEAHIEIHAKLRNWDVVERFEEMFGSDVSDVALSLSTSPSPSLSMRNEKTPIITIRSFLPYEKAMKRWDEIVHTLQKNGIHIKDDHSSPLPLQELVILDTLIRITTTTGSFPAHCRWTSPTGECEEGEDCTKWDCIPFSFKELSTQRTSAFNLSSRWMSGMFLCTLNAFHQKATAR